MLTVTGTYDVLLPIRLHSNRYRALIENAGKGKMHRYYKIENGTYVDSYFNRYRTGPEYVRPILPCYWATFEELEEWVEKEGGDPQPPANTTVPSPTPGATPRRPRTRRLGPRRPRRRLRSRRRKAPARDRRCPLYWHGGRQSPGRQALRRG